MYRNCPCRTLCVAAGLVDQVPGKDGGILAVGAAIDSVHPAGQCFGIVLVQLLDSWVCEEVHMIGDASKLVVQVNTLHPVVNKCQNDLQ